LESPSFHVAQVNIGRPKAPVDSPLLADFKALLDPINAIADAAPGFVWRLQDEGGNATAIPVYDDESLMVNMSVWESIDALWDFVYASDHLAVMRRRREWFERIETFMCLWWVPAGHIPDVREAEERLTRLRAHGPTEHAFTFKQRFAPPTPTLTWTSP
jgi:Domain of unknown function (DUF3291)